MRFTGSGVAFEGTGLGGEEHNSQKILLDKQTSSAQLHAISEAVKLMIFKNNDCVYYIELYLVRYSQS